MTGSGGRTCASAHLLKLRSRALGAIVDAGKSEEALPAVPAVWVRVRVR